MDESCNQKEAGGNEEPGAIVQEAETSPLTENITLEEAAPDEISALQKEISALKEEVKQHHNQYLRVLAEANNHKKRMNKEREEYLKYANILLVKKMIPIMDDLERALTLSKEQQDFEPLYKGVDMILKRLTEAVKSEGVEVIEAQGKEFNPEFHEPLIVEAHSDFESNMIIEELQKGYIMHGRVVRPSLVKVCQ